MQPSSNEPSPHISLQRSKDSKRRRFFLACMLLCALILLVIGLNNIDLKAATSFSLEQQNDPRAAALMLDRSFIIVAFLLLSFVLLLVVPRTLRKRGMIILVIFSLVAFLLYIFDASIGERGRQKPSATPLIQANDLHPQIGGPTQLEVELPPVEFKPPQISNFLLYLISLSITLSFLFIIWILYRQRQFQPSIEPTQSLEEIGEAARMALDDLDAGMGGTDTIINCYARMNQIVMKSCHLERGISRTATEFAARLEAAGLPGGSVRRLTRLFEAARYGKHTSQPFEIEEARNCLTDIARHCGVTV